MYMYIDSKNCIQPGILGIMHGPKWFETLQGADKPMRMEKLIETIQLLLDHFIHRRLYS